MACAANVTHMGNGHRLPTALVITALLLKRTRPLPMRERRSFVLNASARKLAGPYEPGGSPDPPRAPLALREERHADGAGAHVGANRCADAAGGDGREPCLIR